MKKLILGSSALIGVASLATAAQASEGIKLDVGGFFQTVFQGVFNSHNVKGLDSFGAFRNETRILHNAEVHFKGETTLDNGLTVGAQVELEGEQAADQIDKSFVYWSGGFGRVQVGTMDGPIGACPVFPPGATANFSAFSPASWGSNDPIGSNSVCSDVSNESTQIKYTTPNFAGFQVALAYVPSNNANDYNDAGMNGPGTPVNPDGTGHHTFGAYVTYSYAGDGWGVDWGGGGSWNGKFNHADGANDGKNAAYQTALTLTLGGFAVGAIGEYYDTGGGGNNAWTAGGGIGYGVDAWTVGLQGSHGHYKGAGLGFATDPDGSRNLDRIIVTGSYELAPGVLVDAEAGYTWFHDNGGLSAANNSDPRYHAVDLAVGSKFTF
jgi:outer membrane protein OmpU